MRIKCSAPAVLGAIQTWGDSAYVRMLNMPQFILDMFDYNGDGTIGDNDQELIFQIAELAFEIYEETGEFPPPITASDYLKIGNITGIIWKRFPRTNWIYRKTRSRADRPDTLFQCIW